MAHHQTSQIITKRASLTGNSMVCLIVPFFGLRTLPYVNKGNCPAVHNWLTHSGLFWQASNHPACHTPTGSAAASYWSAGRFGAGANVPSRRR